MSTMAQDQLLQPEEGALVGHVLTHLSNGSPGVLGSCLYLVAIRAKQIGDNILNDEHLLEDSGSEDFLLDGQLDLNTLRVRFGPHKVGVNQFHLVNLTHAAQAKAEQLFAFESDCQPTARWFMVTATSLTPLDGYLLGNTVRDVHLAANTVDTHVGRIRRRNLQEKVKIDISGKKKRSRLGFDDGGRNRDPGRKGSN